MKHSLLPILTGIVCFGIALWQYDRSCGNQISDWWFCLSFLGRVSIVGFALCIPWLIYREIFSKKP